jgi:tetratricopeptide (TPR) repeat protein/predicted Ser/Thr protein kinase
MVPAEVQEARADPRRTLGRFVIVSELGRGGMGVVYKAWDDSLVRFVALKLLSGQATPDARERFKREAHATASLRHPAIVSVHEAGELQGHAYLCMDFIEGTTLAGKIRDKVLPLTVGVEILKEVARAIDYAHGHGVVHRDLKPQNIMISRDGHPYVLDFGLATLRTADSVLTKSGTTLGTPSYMPPEQVDGSGKTVDARSDVYSLGATLYQVITGEPPFLGSELAVITALLTLDPVPPSRQNRRAAGDLDTISLKCLEKDPAKRYATAEALALDLEHYLRGESIVARPLGPVGRAARALRRNARSVVAAAIAALLSAAAIGYPAVRSGLEARTRRAASDSARRAIFKRADDLRASIAGVLSGVNARLEALPVAAAGADGVAALMSSAAAAVVPLEDDAKVRADLASLGGDAAAADRELAVDDAERRLGRAALLARANRLEARGYSLLGRGPEATRERARAYRLDPAGADGQEAFLEIAESLLEKTEFQSALDIFTTLASHPLPAALAARADLGIARVRLALGDLPLARAYVRRALASGALVADEARQARFFEAIATKLALPVTEPIAVYSAVFSVPPGGGPPDVIGLSGEPLGLGASRLDAARTGYVEFARLELPAGVSCKNLVALHAPGARRFALLTARDVRIYAFEEARFTLERTIPFEQRDSAAGAMVAADFDGDGSDDLAVVLKPNDRRGQYVLAIFDPLGAARRQLLMADGVPCDWFTVGAADLDGGGKATLLVAGTEWGFAFNFFESPGPGQPFPETHAARPMGSPVGPLLVGKRAGREYLLAGAERVRYSDGCFESAPDLDVSTPTAVWRVSRGAPGPPDFEPVVARPFERRREGKVAALAVGLFASYPDLLVAREDAGSLHRLLFVPGAPLASVSVGFRDGDRWPGLLRAIDLDGDGEPDLVFQDPKGFVVSGLKALGPAPDVASIRSSVPIDATPLDVGLDLLDCGEAREAAIQLAAVVGRPETLPADRVRGQLAFARALALDGHPDRARETCLELAAREPRLAKDALLQASACAEEQRDFAGAVSDLERLRQVSRLSPDEAREVERRLRRLGPFARFEEVLRIDREHASEQPFEVDEPLLVARSERGIRVRSADRGGGYAVWHLPVRYDGSSFRMKVRFFAEEVPFGTYFSIGLDTPSGSLKAGAYTEGGGTINTWYRGAGCDGHYPDVGNFAPDEPVDVEITYVEADARVVASVVHGSWSSSHTYFLAHALGRGASSIRVVLSGKDNPSPFESIDIESLVMEAPRGAIVVEPFDPKDDEKKALMAAERVFSLGDRASAAPLLARLALEAKSGSVRNDAGVLGALARAEAGEGDEARADLVRLMKEAPDEVKALAGVVHALGRRSREALARALGAPPRGELRGVLQRGLGSLGVPRGEAALAFLAAGPGVGPEETFYAAEIWARAGDNAFALELLGRLGDAPELRLHAGFYACALGRYGLALEKWRGLELRGNDLPYLHRAERYGRK